MGVLQPELNINDDSPKIFRVYYIGGSGPPGRPSNLDFRGPENHPKGMNMPLKRKL